MCPWTPTLTPSLQQSQPPPVPTPLAPTTCPALQLEPSCGASQPGSGTVGGQPRSGWPERTVRGAGCLSGCVLPDYWRPVAPAGASVVALGYAHSAPQFSSTERTAAALPSEPGQRPAPPRLSACSPSPVTLPPAPRAADEVEKQARAPDNASRKSSAAARRESTGTRSRGVYRCDERSP